MFYSVINLVNSHLRNQSKNIFSSPKEKSQIFSTNDTFLPLKIVETGIYVLPKVETAAEVAIRIGLVGDYGNCIAASIPMALAHAKATGRLHKGDRVLLLGTGAGLSIAAAIIQW